MNLFISGLNESADVWLIGKNYLTGSIQPLPNSSDVSLIGTEDNPFHFGYFDSVSNRFGGLQVNTVTSSVPILNTEEHGNVHLDLLYDPQQLTINNEGQLTIKQRILTPSEIEIVGADPIYLEIDPSDELGGTIHLKYDDEDFKLSDQGFLKTIDLNLVGRGGISIRGGDIELGEFDAKLKAIKLETSADFTQTNGKLEIVSQGAGRVCLFDTSGLDSNAYLTFDGTTLFSRFFKTDVSYSLPDDYLPSVAYLMQAYQSQTNGAIDISAPANGRRIVSVRTDNRTIKVNSANQLETIWC